MTTILQIKQGDLLPAFTATLFETNDNVTTPIDLTGATVELHVRMTGAPGLKIDATATVTDAAAGKIRYDWIAGDTDTPGECVWEAQITYGDGKQLTVPNSREGYVGRMSPQLG